MPTTPPPDTAAKSGFSANLLFDYDKAELTPQEKQKLDQLIPQIKEANPEKLILVGHTDSNGADSYNEKLSLRRVETVKSYLVTKGVDKNRIQIEAKSETQPVRDNDTTNNRAANRRVELVWQ